MYEKVFLSFTEGHDVLSVHYEVVPDDNTERGASPMYTSLQVLCNIEVVDTIK